MPLNKSHLLTCAVLVVLTILYVKTSSRDLQETVFAAQKVAIHSTYQPQHVGHHEARLGGDRVIALRRNDDRTAAAAEDAISAALSSITTRQQALAAASALYDGEYVEDPDFFFSECLRRDAPNLCDLVRYTNETGVWVAEGNDPAEVSSLKRWIPSNPHPACPFKYYSQNQTLGLLREMGIKKVHLMGDSMQRYFGFVFIGVLTNTPRLQYVFHFDFSLLIEPELDIEVWFYWRQTIDDLHKAIDTSESYVCTDDDSLTIINNNLHQIIAHQESFMDAESRYGEVKGVFEHARRKCGDHVLWRGPNQVASGSRTWKGKDDNVLTFGEGIDLDALTTLPRLVKELDAPIFDVYSITDKAFEDNIDGLHYNRWELEAEVHVLLSQLECLHNTGFWPRRKQAGATAEGR